MITFKQMGREIYVLGPEMEKCGRTYRKSIKQMKTWKM